MTTRRRSLVGPTLVSLAFTVFVGPGPLGVLGRGGVRPASGRELRDRQTETLEPCDGVRDGDLGLFPCRGGEDERRSAARRAHEELVVRLVPRLQLVPADEREWSGFAHRLSRGRGAGWAGAVAG